MHIFAAVRPVIGEDFALVLSDVPAAAMGEFLRRFAATRAPDEHAVMGLDGAGGHDRRAIRLPDNISLVTLPPYGPGPNPVARGGR